jgi:hypothetical protein
MPDHPNYVPVPVEAARQIADRFNKHIVGVVAFDRDHAPAGGDEEAGASC